MPKVPEDNNEQRSEVLLFVEELMKRENKKILQQQKKEKLKEEKKNLVNSYGAVMLDNNIIINIKYNFYFLEQLWLKWVYAKSFNMEEELKELKSITNGGIFNSGDTIFSLDDIKMLFKPELYYNSSPEQKITADIKNAMINKYISGSIFNAESVFYDEYIEEEEDYDEDDEF